MVPIQHYDVGMVHRMHYVTMHVEFLYYDVHKHDACTILCICKRQLTKHSCNEL